MVAKDSKTLGDNININYNYIKLKGQFHIKFNIVVYANRLLTTTGPGSDSRDAEVILVISEFGSKMTLETHLIWEPEIMRTSENNNEYK